MSSFIKANSSGWLFYALLFLTNLSDVVSTRWTLVGYMLAAFAVWFISDEDGRTGVDHVLLSCGFIFVAIGVVWLGFEIHQTFLSVLGCWFAATAGTLLGIWMLSQAARLGWASFFLYISRKWVE